ncbi:MAG: RtcB family protein [archaeon]
MTDTNRINSYTVELPQHDKMHVPGIVFASPILFEKIQQDKTLEQVRNVACLPGIIKWSIAMPDAHQGYGFPIGGVAAFDYDTGIISPGGVGYDINCLLPGTNVLCELGYTTPIEQIGNALPVEITSNGFGLAFVHSGICVRTLGAEAAKPVAAFMKKKSDRRVFEVKTRTGLQLACSEDHPIFTSQGMIEAGLLVPGTNVAVSYFEGIPYQKSEWKDETDMGIVAKVFGYMLGDGSLTRWRNKYCIRVYGKETDMARMQKDLARIGINSRYTKISRNHRITTQYGEKTFRGTTTELRIYSKKFAERLLTLGFPLGNKTDKPYRIPAWVVDAPLWIVRLFLAGFFGAELSSPSTHSKTGFYAPILSQNKSARLEEVGREFLIDIMQLLERFGVKVTTIASRQEHPNKQGKVIRLRLELGAEEENLLALWRKIGFEYNAERSLCAEIACKYILQKKRLQSTRAMISFRVRELKKQGLRLAEVQRLLVRQGVANARFIERQYYECAGQRITLDFPSFAAFAKEQAERYAVAGTLFDVIESVNIMNYEGDVYDITVDTTHNFFANGFVVSNCGVRLLSTPFTTKDLEGKKQQLLDRLFNYVPPGVGRDSHVKLTKEDLKEVLNTGITWCIAHGYATKEDAQRIEEQGSMSSANAEMVSDTALSRGIKQLGTLGSGNHFLELQLVDKILDKNTANAFGIRHEGQVVIMIHCGSRGLGHQVCSDYLKKMEQEYGTSHLPDRELTNAPFHSVLGQQYYKAMCAAMNFAFCNRQLITHFVRKACKDVLGSDENIDIVYDVCHNIAKVEQHLIDGVQRKVIVHRKGATRSFGPGREEIPAVYRALGQPILIPGSMGTASYVLVGTAKAEALSFGSTAHGAGRVASRTYARATVTGEEVTRELAAKGILIKGASKKGIAEEAPAFYKDVDEVVRVSHEAGIGNIVARLIPVGVVKG